MHRLAAGAAGVSELATGLDMPKSAVHRLLQELVRLGWAERMQDGRYAASLRFALLGRDVLRRTGLFDTIQPLLDALAAEQRELVRLTVADRGGLSWLGSAQGAPAGLMYQPEMAGSLVLHATANGKAFLAAHDDAMACELAGDALGRVRPTAHSITTPAALIRELALVRVRGYAVADGEAERGVVAVAVAIRPHAGPATGTLSIAGPKVRMPESRFPTVAAALARTAATLATIPPFEAREETACASN
jgi:DNA-binding IclR family transcriptional regulator